MYFVNGGYFGMKDIFHFSFIHNAKNQVDYVSTDVLDITMADVETASAIYIYQFPDTAFI